MLQLAVTSMVLPAQLSREYTILADCLKDLMLSLLAAKLTGLTDAMELSPAICCCQFLLVYGETWLAAIVKFAV